MPIDALRGKVRHELVDDMLFAMLFELGGDDRRGISVGLCARLAQDRRRPTAGDAVAPRLHLEGEFLVVLIFALETFLAFVETAHRSPLSGHSISQENSMCTLILLRRPGHDWPVIVGANRDEMKARPWRPPGRHWPDRPEVVAGLDELAGGSWL